MTARISGLSANVPKFSSRIFSTHSRGTFRSRATRTSVQLAVYPVVSLSYTSCSLAKMMRRSSLVSTRGPPVGLRGWRRVCVYVPRRCVGVECR